ncbi:hypothetical protein Ct9H90mP29_10560 [bacterium]|nr:MAG: hypothetical protein Ct9H90mP29_10560 [bacterium]
MVPTIVKNVWKPAIIDGEFQLGVIHDPAHTNNYSPQYVYDQESNTGKYEAVDPK